MKVKAAEFIRSCVHRDQYPRESLPELTFVGRSNVGKSSLINSLLNRKALAKVSTTPGKTRTVNFFRVTPSAPSLQDFYLVDLPGYGYAKASKSVREQWPPMIEQHFTSRKELCGVILLIDARRIEPHDVTTHAWLQHIGYHPVVVATKVDKLSRAERVASRTRIQQALTLPDTASLLAYSSRTHEGRLELWQALGNLIKKTRDE